MNILITGANGQLGNEMRRIAASTKADDHYFFTDVAELDICDAAAVEAFVGEQAIEAIVNCAAFTNVNGAETNVELCDKLNHWAPGNLARAAAAHHCRFIHISTDYVFDGNHYLPYKEEDEPCRTPSMAERNWMARRWCANVAPKPSSSAQRGCIVPSAITS